jgi:predicted secreted protein
MAPKQTSTDNGQKVQRTKASAKPVASKESAKVKTVDIALSPESSKKRAAKTKAVKTKKRSTAKSASTKTRSQAQSKSKKESALNEAVREKVAMKSESAQEVETVEVLTPSPQALRAFRKASAQSRQIAKRRAAKAGARQRGFLKKVAKTGKRYAFDLRVHSPGTDGYFSTDGVDSAQALVRLAKAKGLDMIGVTDHYNAAFVDVIREAAEGVKIKIIPGLDLRCRIGSCDEVYLVALFPEATPVSKLFAVLEALEVPESAFGKKGYCIEKPFRKVIEVVEGASGVMIPCHVDKTPYRQLAIVPLVDEYGFNTFDLVHPEHNTYFRERWPSGGFTFLSFSNANSLAQVGTRIAKAKLTKPGFEGIAELVKRNTED